MCEKETINAVMLDEPLWVFTKAQLPFYLDVRQLVVFQVEYFKQTTNAAAARMKTGFSKTIMGKH